MNIQFLTPKIISYSNKADIKHKSSVNSSNLANLNCDTVSFAGKLDNVKKVSKVLENKVFKEWDFEHEMLHRDIVKVTDSFEQPVKEFLLYLKHELKPITSTESRPDKIIMSKGIYGGVKGAISAAIKSNSRKIFTSQGLEQMGDIGRGRIVLRSASQKDFNVLFKYLSDMVKKGMKVKEVENYRLTPKTSYVSQNTLNNFETVCNKYGQYPEIISKARKNGYTAVHMLVELPDGKPLELQIMGRDMEKAKDANDFYYKYFCNKKFAEKYAPIQEIFDKFMPKLTPFQKESLDMYIKDAFGYALLLPAKSSKCKNLTEKDFLPFPYHLPQELSYKNIYKMMLECNKKAT